jgi:hypothetical protein
MLAQARARGEMHMRESAGKPSIEELREKLEKLFKDAGYIVPELRDFFEDAELHGQIEQSAAKQVNKSVLVRKSSYDSMASKLRDALRE